jgi:hypothetical protein
MLKGIQTITAVLLNPENVGLGFGIPLLSEKEDRIMRYLICTSGIGGHL